jgi:NADPH:quinone reductase-like Zn-dependent oxidoreductase
VLVGLMGESDCVFNPAIMLARRLTIRGFTLRSQSVQAKQAIVERVKKDWMPLVEQNRLGPVLHGTMPLARAADAHRLIESNQTIGKVILTVD